MHWPVYRKNASYRIPSITDCLGHRDQRADKGTTESSLRGPIGSLIDPRPFVPTRGVPVSILMALVMDRSESSGENRSSSSLTMSSDIYFTWTGKHRKTRPIKKISVLPRLSLPNKISIEHCLSCRISTEERHWHIPHCLMLTRPAIDLTCEPEWIEEISWTATTGTLPTMHSRWHILTAITTSMLMTFLLHCALDSKRAPDSFYQLMVSDLVHETTLHMHCYFSHLLGT